MYGQIIKERQPEWSGCKYERFGSCWLISSYKQLHLSHCVLGDRLVPWYLFLILNEAENFVRDRLAGREPLASKAFKDLLPVGRAFFRNWIGSHKTIKTLWNLKIIWPISPGMPFLSSPFDFIPFTFESLGLLNTIFMKSLKAGQYIRAQPLQKQFIKTVFLVVVFFFNIRTIVKPRGGKMVPKDHGGKKVMGVV